LQRGAATMARRSWAALVALVELCWGVGRL
jgi:hypothetical protein